MENIFPERKHANILGVRIDNYSIAEAKAFSLEMLANGKNNLIVTPNPEMVMSCQEDEELKKVINETADLSIPDGAGLQWGSWILGESLYNRTPGIDLMQELLSVANERGLRIYLLGGAAGIAQTAADRIKQQFPKIIIAGVNDGFFTKYDESELIHKIENLSPDILFVGLGAAALAGFAVPDALVALCRGYERGGHRAGAAQDSDAHQGAAVPRASHAGPGTEGRTGRWLAEQADRFRTRVRTGGEGIAIPCGPGWTAGEVCG